jgi:TolB-like protein
MRRLLLLLVLLLAPVARSETGESEVRPSVAVLPLEANEAGRDTAPGLSALLLSRLAESLLLEVRSPTDPEASSSGVGARYVVSGRVDRFGSRYVLTATLVEAPSGRVLARPRQEVSAIDALPFATVALADLLRTALVPVSEAQPLAPASGLTRGPGMGSFSVGLRLNNSFINQLASLNPGADLELGYLFHPEWMAFSQIGFSYVRSEEEGRTGGLNVLPSVVGLRHYHGLENPLRPYWGFGLGVQLSFGEYGIFQQTGPLPTVVGFAGLEYLIAGRLGFQLEAGTNLAQATLGLASNHLGSGLNLDLNAGIVWHF